MRNNMDKQIDQALYRYGEKRVHALEEKEGVPHIFSNRFYIKRRKMTGRRRLRPAAAVAAVVMVLFFGISAGAFWEDIYRITVDAKDKFFSFFSEGADKEGHPTDTLLIKNVPDRFDLDTIDITTNMTFYSYSSESGDIIHIFEEVGAQETSVDSETDNELLYMYDRDIYFGYKEEQQMYTIYFRYDHNVTVSIAGNITKEEAFQLIDDNLNK